MTVLCMAWLIVGSSFAELFACESRSRGLSVLSEVKPKQLTHLLNGERKRPYSRNKSLHTTKWSGHG
jgi:hypothetical protein